MYCCKLHADSDKIDHHDILVVVLKSCYLYSQSWVLFELKFVGTEASWERESQSCSGLHREYCFHLISFDLDSTNRTTTSQSWPLQLESESHSKNNVITSHIHHNGIESEGWQESREGQSEGQGETQSEGQSEGKNQEEDPSTTGFESNL